MVFLLCKHWPSMTLFAGDPEAQVQNVRDPHYLTMKLVGTWDCILACVCQPSSSVSPSKTEPKAIFPASPHFPGVFCLTNRLKWRLMGYYRDQHVCCLPFVAAFAALILTVKFWLLLGLDNTGRVGFNYVVLAFTALAATLTLWICLFWQRTYK